VRDYAGVGAGIESGRCVATGERRRSTAERNLRRRAARCWRRCGSRRFTWTTVASAPSGTRNAPQTWSEQLPGAPSSTGSVMAITRLDPLQGFRSGELAPSRPRLPEAPQRADQQLRRSGVRVPSAPPIEPPAGWPGHLHLHPSWLKAAIPECHRRGDETLRDGRSLAVFAKLGSPSKGGLERGLCRGARTD
jgi:hypothetical protein